MFDKLTFEINMFSVILMLINIQLYIMKMVTEWYRKVDVYRKIIKLTSKLRQQSFSPA